MRNERNEEETSKGEDRKVELVIRIRPRIKLSRVTREREWILFSAMDAKKRLFEQSHLEYFREQLRRRRFTVLSLKGGGREKGNIRWGGKIRWTKWRKGERKGGKETEEGRTRARNKESVKFYIIKDFVNCDH